MRGIYNVFCQQGLWKWVGKNRYREAVRTQKKAGEPAFLCFVTTDSPIVTQPAEGQMKTPDPQGIVGPLGSTE